ncbi:glycosyltransferase [Candidatus Pacearchaeota archaeon]|nr:glycosyltransferase [Candidatus Pacearchaeota archaeon]
MKLLFAPWNAEDKLDYPYQNWYLPLKKSASSMQVFDPRKYYFKYGKDAMNKEFLQLIKRFKPHFVFLSVIYDEFYLETFKKVKEVSPSTKLINFFSDDESRFEIYSKYFAPFFDVCITTYLPAYLQAKKLGLSNFYLMPYSCNTHVFKKLKTEKKYDVSFIGQPSNERVSMLKHLLEAGINVNIWGKGWDSVHDSIIQKAYRGFAKDMVQITNESRIIPSFLIDDSGKVLKIKGRLAEVAGCGTFQVITDNNETKGMLRSGKEAAYFSSASDLVKKVKYYLKHESERERIAQNAYKHIVKNYNWDTLFREFFRRTAKFSAVSMQEKTALFITYTDSPISSTTPHRQVNASSLSQEEIHALLLSMSEEYLCIIDYPVSFSKGTGVCRTLGLAAGHEILLNDYLYVHPALGEICALRTEPSLGQRGIETVFPLPCYAFSREFVKRNVPRMLQMIREKHIVLQSIADKEKIAYPLLECSRAPLGLVKDKQHLLAKKFEVALFNHWYAKHYLRFGAYLALLYSKLLSDGNLFILGSVSEYTKILKKTRL